MNGATRKSRLLEVPVENHSERLADTSNTFRFSAAVASFGMLLRDSKDRGTASYELVAQWAGSGLGDDAFGYRREFLGMVRRASELARD